MSIFCPAREHTMPTRVILHIAWHEHCGYSEATVRRPGMKGPWGNREPLIACGTEEDTSARRHAEFLRLGGRRCRCGIGGFPGRMGPAPRCARASLRGVHVTCLRLLEVSGDGVRERARLCLSESGTCCSGPSKPRKAGWPTCLSTGQCSLMAGHPCNSMPSAKWAGNRNRVLK